MPFQIVITMEDTGQIKMTAPMDQKIVCYGMLEIARCLVDAHKPGEQRIIPAGGVLPPAFPGTN